MEVQMVKSKCQFFDLELGLLPLIDVHQFYFL